MAGTLTRLRNLTRLSGPLRTSSRPASGASGTPTRTQEELTKYVEEQTKNVRNTNVFYFLMIHSKLCNFETQ